jgi:hypothetical protein
MPESATILLQCSSRFRSEDAEIAEIVRYRKFTELWSFGLFAICDGICAIIINPFAWVFLDLSKSLK